MRFSRVGQHVIKCVITEDEITDLGYTLEDIMSNGERTQEFMNRIFDLAEQEFQTKFDMGIKTVRADFLPDHTLSLTFSEHPAESSGMMEHLKDIVSGLLNSIPNEKWEAMRQNAEENKKMDAAPIEEDDDVPNVIVLFEFDDMDTVIRYTKHVSLEEIPYNALYKRDGIYYLMMDLSDCTEEEVKALSMLTDEYANDILVGSERRAFFEEHGDIIIAKEAIETLRQL